MSTQPKSTWIHVLLFFYIIFLTPWALQGVSVDDLSLEDKIGQLLMVHFEGEEVNEDIIEQVQHARIGGVIYYTWSNGLTSPTQVRTLSLSLQKLAKEKGLLPLFIATDQEGGAISRLGKGFTDFPGNGALGRCHDTELAYKTAYAIGKELKAVGINFNLAPVVDVNNNPQNPIIGVRSFGSSPDIVTIYGKEQLRGYLDSGVLACLKHFPGHGDVTVDSHIGRPRVNKHLHELQEMELVPFLEIGNEAPAIMTAHILFPQIDPVYPTSLSKKMTQQLLREKMRFEGVILTDSLTMGGVLQGATSVEDVAIEAFNAGSDILMIVAQDLETKIADERYVNNVINLSKKMVSAVRQGRISEERVNESVARILKLKERGGLFTAPPPTPADTLKYCHCKNHVDLAKEVAYCSVKINKGSIPLDFTGQKIALILPYVLKQKIESFKLDALGGTATLCFYDFSHPSKSEANHILETVEESDHAIFLSYNAWKFPAQLELIARVASEVPTALIATRDPYDLNQVMSTEVEIATYSPAIPSLHVALEYLSGHTNILRLTPKEIEDIGQRIWDNESQKSKEQLIFWNENEDFPSFGIGHYIWPPKSYNGPFSEGRFHDVLTYFKEHDIELPSWLENEVFSPWETREEFYNNFNSQKMLELRELLLETLSIQSSYMVTRLNYAFFNMIHFLSPEEKTQVIKQFFRVATLPNGPFILTDYLNFKHEGTDPKERYKGQGWGLLQVLQEMAHIKEPKTPVKDFISSAKKLLETRVQNAPAHKHEEKWIPGWMGRLKKYELLE